MEIEEKHDKFVKQVGNAKKHVWEGTKDYDNLSKAEKEKSRKEKQDPDKQWLNL